MAIAGTDVILCAQYTRVNSTQRVHFRAPETLVKQADAIAAAEGRNRTDVLVEALRSYLEDASDEQRVKQAIANAYYKDDLEFEAVKAVLAAKQAQNVRVLKRQLIDERLSQELAAALDE